MSNFSLYVPVVARVRRAEDVTRKMLEIQVKEGGKVSIISIHQDVDTKDWVIFYYPYKNMPQVAL